jgi:hypothetical protein
VDGQLHAAHAQKQMLLGIRYKDCQWLAKYSVNNAYIPCDQTMLSAISPRSCNNRSEASKSKQRKSSHREVESTQLMSGLVCMKHQTAHKVEQPEFADQQNLGRPVGIH